MEEPWGPRRGPRRNKQWRTISHGLHRPVAATPGRHGDLPAWQLVLPASGAFTHLTAARVYDWWLPPLPDDLPVFACQSKLDARPRRTGLKVTRHPHAPEPVVRYGLRLAPPAETLLACARHSGLLDLVVLVDAARRARDCDVSDLMEVADGRPGARLLRRAVQLSDPRAESAWESLLRVFHVLNDVPVEPQHEIFDPTGAFVARGDLWIKGTRVLHEYDGGVHLERAQQRKDLRRARRLADVGWTRRGYTAQDLLGQAAGVLRDADVSLGRPHEPARVRPWYALLADSLFTQTGTARFRARLGLDPATSGHKSRVRDL